MRIKALKCKFKVQDKTLLTIALICLSVASVQIVHIFFGQTVARQFLPMHLPVFVCGLLLGSGWGMIAGAFSPMLSFLLSGMPVADKLPSMIVELTIYGGVSGLFAKSNKILAGVILAQIAGRIATAVLTVVSLKFGETIPSGYLMSLTANALYGIIIQIITIPVITFFLRKAYKDDRKV